MKCGVPVIVQNEGTMTEICGDAALYFNPHDHENLAEQMMTIFKDEELRTVLIEKSKPIVQKYNWATTSELFLECILKAIH
jgi:glycosyltransferase involved in cell wall biosynthesis